MLFIHEQFNIQELKLIPGRVDQLNLFSIQAGLFFRQCSEICGTNRRFMLQLYYITNYSNFKF